MLTKKEKLTKFRKRIENFAISPGKNIRTPVLIGGEQRSGTNFLINVLNRCKRTECYLENDEEAFNDYVLKDVDTVKRLVDKSHAKLVVFKPICDSQNFGMLLSTFPNAKAIWTYRHYNDVINSSLRNFTEHRKYLHYMLHEPAKAGWRLENVTPEDLEKVRYFYDKGIDDASSRGLIWHLRNSLFFQQNLDKNPNVMMTKYENLVSKPVEYFERVYRFLGLGNDPKASAIAFSSSLGKNTPPSLDEEIIDLCEDTLSKLNQYYSLQKL